MSVPQLSLPQFIVMRSGVSGKYLRYGKGKGRSTRSSSLSFSHEAERPSSEKPPLKAEKMPSTTLKPSVQVSESLESLKSEKTPLEFHLLKFEVEEAKNAPGFVHIRTCYNHKYLVRKSEESKRLVAESHEAEEDQSKWSCTLFKPVFLGEAEEEEGRDCVYGSNKHGVGMRPHKIQLLHLVNDEEEFYVSESMELVKKEEESLKNITTLTVSDVNPTAELPKYVTFKCHDGSKYLGSPDWEGLFFKYSDMADQGVAMVNLDYGSGPTSVAILSTNQDQTKGGVWTLCTNRSMVLCPNSGWRYIPVKVNNYVAMYSAPDQNQFLQHDPSWDNRLVMINPDINEEAQLQVGEPVLSRTILKITYDLDNARVYDTTNVTKIIDSRSNYTDHQDTGSLSRDFTMSQTMNWSQSITLGISMSMSMSLGIPTLGLCSEFSIKYDISGTATWGEETSHTETVTHTYNFDVPPMTKQTKSVVASRSSCDVPFTCDVEDVLVDGTVHKYTILNCLFTGANDYNDNEKTYEEPLTAAA